MFDFIPLEYYTPIWYYTILILVLLAFIQLQTKGYVIYNTNKKKYASLILLLGVILYMGLRPISFVFVDMGTYSRIFEYYANGAQVNILGKDVWWNIFMKVCSGIMTAEYFFLLCSIFYITPLYIVSKKWLGGNRYFIFLMFIASFSFWAYGTNGIRNGIATSLFVLGISYTNKRILQYGITTLSFFVHASTIIPISAFIVSIFYKNPKHYLMGWLFCIPLSLAFGGVFENLFASLGFQDDRLSYLTEGNINNDNFAYTGFRWDFLIYSASAVFAGYYFIIKKQFKDKIYIQLFNIYVMANAFWILVIRANFSNRFAYLSWFLMAVVIFYPFLKKRFFKNQYKVLAYVILAYFGFTYLMFLIN
tara:strand:+ start:2299 stop:3387 length:1089 start_codon:yes stop_codon:yes gene_type:complete